MTTKEAIERRQIPTWNEWADQIRQREQARKERNEKIGYRPPICRSYDHAD